MAETTPMMQQYFEIKKQTEDCILFYRLGDFYEMFYDDAKLASKELDLTLTGRDCGQEERAPMCGVPYHSCESYIARLVSRGYKVAICEQMEDPKLAKGLVKRDIVRIITPGTVTDNSMLDERKNNYIASICAEGEVAGIAFADVSTGALSATMLDSGGNLTQRLINELAKFNPREILLNGDANVSRELMAFISEKLEALLTPYEQRHFDYDECLEIINNKFPKDISREILDFKLVVSASGALINYLLDTQKKNLINISSIEFYKQSEYMELDAATRRNLELTETMRKGEKRGSLLGVLDRTKTSMGGRLLRRWIEQPLCSAVHINNRLTAVDALYAKDAVRDTLSENLKGVYDIERIISRVVFGTANCRDLKSLEATLSKLPAVKAAALEAQNGYLTRLADEIDDLDDIRQLIAKAIEDEPPFSVREGGLIKKGYNETVDELRMLMTDSRSLLAGIENREREETGIKNLRIAYNKVFGYFIEVTNSYLSMVPERYIRKQTLTNCERFITEELKTIEEKVLSASEHVKTLEYELFLSVRDKVMAASDRIQSAAQSLAALDVLCGFAEAARKNRYTMPEIITSGAIDIKEGRHPVVEDMLNDTMFVPNDTLLDCGDNRLAIITGPNMAGKSTYMRQVAIIVLMAQVGSFVPAKSAKIPVADKIFTRVGASDDLSTGRSTFMVEMSEVAYILKNATKNSLIIFDEIGRGTSTFDGMSIARAVLEFAADKKKLGAKTLFATHYHELTELEGQFEGVKNYNIAVKKRGDDITFLRRIVRGGADESYGIEVAKLAGVPDTVIERAKHILKDLDGGKETFTRKNIVQSEAEDDFQLNITGESQNALLKEIIDIDLNTLTPIEGMNKLYELKKRAEKIIVC
ncbi:MAG: DNA mismatch repair protein MutS [Bacillota bacterium]|nr:DNA mismatch repair protein MutS [Bacillota bacterium]